MTDGKWQCIYNDISSYATNLKESDKEGSTGGVTPFRQGEKSDQKTGLKRDVSSLFRPGLEKAINV